MYYRVKVQQNYEIYINQAIMLFEKLLQLFLIVLTIIIGLLLTLTKVHQLNYASCQNGLF